MRFNIKVTEELKEVAPEFVGAAIYTRVKNSKYSEGLWIEINEFCKYIKDNYTTADIKLIEPIQATREVYKKCKKDPNRYRPAAEALRRRIIRGLSLYQIDTLVDMVNLVSLESGLSMGGFDASYIKGDTLTLGIGKENEKFEGIGRGILNIEGLPVYRDAIGGIGTPTSDEERTKLRVDTEEFLALLNGYSGATALEKAVKQLKELLVKYADADLNDIQVVYYQ